MTVKGLPERFWVVTVPTPLSTVEDISFRCNFARFACQIRGGLHEDAIVGIFAEEADARDAAERLLAGLPDAN